MPQVRVERIALPDGLLTCQAAPQPPAAGTQRDVADYLVDLWIAGEDCRGKIGAIKALAGQK